MAIIELTTEHVVNMPAKKEPGILYVSTQYGLAIHLCACGCGGEAVTPLQDKEVGISGWSYTETANGPTLKPSIGHQHWPCGSHYFVTNGRIELCSDHGLNKTS